MHITKGGNLLFMLNERFNKLTTHQKLVSLSLIKDWAINEMDKLDKRPLEEKLLLTSDYEREAAEYNNFSPARVQMDKSMKELIFHVNKN